MPGKANNHRVAYRKLGRPTAHRLAMLRTMVDQLIVHERIRTTVPKAKELRRVADWMINLGRKGDHPAEVDARAFLRTNEAVDKLFDVLGERYVNRPSGFTRVLQVGHRRGDAADMAVIEFVDRPGELRTSKPVSKDTVLRNQLANYPCFRDLLPSRDYIRDPHIHVFPKNPKVFRSKKKKA